MADNGFTKVLKEHTKQDNVAFESIHSHLDRLDKATNTDLIVYKIDELKTQFNTLEAKIDNNFVTKTEFDPIKRLVYGMVALILVGVLSAILAAIIKKG